MLLLNKVPLDKGLGGAQTHWGSGWVRSSSALEHTLPWDGKQGGGGAQLEG